MSTVAGPRSHTATAASGAAAGEDREALPQRAFVVVEQVPAPVDDRPQRLVAGQRGPAAADQHPEPVVQPFGELRDRHRAQPGRGQLDRERHAVQRPAQLRPADRGRRPGSPAGRRRPGRRRAGPRTGAPTWPRRRQAERLDRPQCLAGDRQRLAAGGEDPHGRDSGSSTSSVSPAARRHQMLAVVQDDQQSLVPQRLDEPLGRVHCGSMTDQRAAGRPAGSARAGRARSARSRRARPGRSPGPARPATPRPGTRRPGCGPTPAPVGSCRRRPARPA